MWVPSRPETYQHVKADLTAVTVVLLYLYGFFAASTILPSAHRDIIKNFLATVTENFFLQQGILIPLLTGIAVVLVYLLEIHDRIYDRFVIRWRKYYDIDLTLRALCMPFGNKLRERFLEEAQRDRGPFMRDLFYHFVRDRDHRISRNAIVRFYERIWKYWITQINELLLIALFVLAAFYGLFGRGHNVEFYVPVIIFGLVIANRFFAIVWLAPVRRATLEEIHEIHENHLAS